MHCQLIAKCTICLQLLSHILNMQEDITIATYTQIIGSNDVTHKETSANNLLFTYYKCFN